MKLRSLRIENLRLIEQGDVEFSPDWNVIVGSNGAGKTTLLEGAYLLSHGRSFRSTLRDTLSREGSLGYAVFGEVEYSGGTERVGIARTPRKLEARLNGGAIAIGDLVRHVAVVCFEPGSHALIGGSSEERRRYLDWGVFHVEQDFLGTWRRYQRALRQRNALLRQGAIAQDLEPWNRELSIAATPLTVQRVRYFDALRPLARGYLLEFLPELGEPVLTFRPGFDARLELAETLAGVTTQDRARGYTSAGPHRADWSVTFERLARREYLSRGQEKLCAFALVLAQASLFRSNSGEWPVVCLDDLSSEVDAAHLERILGAIDGTGAQVLLTGTAEPVELENVTRPVTRFHVEQGQVARLL